MYQIGLFSKMNHVTIKTLRHYDEIGLLKPTQIDLETGYRYYSLGQSYILHRIVALKRMGFSLGDIKEIMGGKPKNHFLSKRKTELLLEIAENTRKLAEVEYYLANDEDHPLEKCEVLMKLIPEVMVASMRNRISSHNDLFQIMSQMRTEMGLLGCTCARPEYCFTVYHDGEYKESDIDIEICEAVTERKRDSSRIVFKTMPQINKAACLFHKGHYEDLPQSYLALMTWIDVNGYEPDGFPRESYIYGIWNKENPAEWLTEIQFPIKPKELQRSTILQKH